MPYARLLKVAVLVATLGALYAVAVHKHAERERIRHAPVALTPGCEEKLAAYALAPDAHYRSPYVLKTSGASPTARGYSDEDVRAVQRGCNIVDDLQGHLAKDAARERWYATRYVRGPQTTCDHCHQGVGDKHDAAGNRVAGSNNLGAS